MKKETMKEAAERLYPVGQFEEFYGDINEFSKKVFLQGVKSELSKDYWFKKFKKEIR